jgi:signal transduction histidine kinase
MRDTQFLSIVAHELKTPIAVITGLAATLSTSRHNLTDAQIDDCLDRIGRQGERLTRLVADLLDLSQSWRCPNPCRCSPTRAAWSRS